MLLLSTASSSYAGSATWLASPATGDWNTAGNWTAGGPPNGSTDTATFESSNIIGVSLSLNTEVNGIVFNAGASAFTITASPMFVLTISGVGITNNSGITQNFVIAVDSDTGTVGQIIFANSATAGSLTAFNNVGSMSFFGSSTAANGTFTNNGGSAGFAFGASMAFNETSTAGNGTFTNDGGAVSGATGGGIQFFDSSTAGNGTFTINGAPVSGAGFGGVFFVHSYIAGTPTAGDGIFTINGSAVSGEFTGGEVGFGESSTAGNATLIANGGADFFPPFRGAGGLIFFAGGSTGGTARVEVFGNGVLDISQDTFATVTIGSIEGSGLVFLGGNGSFGATNLTVGNNNLSTTFSGKIQDGGNGGGTGGGSLTKIGRGKLTLSKASTYTGGTTVSNGTLLVTNRTGSATGTGAVQVNKGTLGGLGIITGAVTVGTGHSSGAIVLAGKSATAPGILTINSALTFTSRSTYQCVLNRRTPIAGEITALGVTINSGASFTFVDVGTGTLTVGTVFTVINNTSANPVFGTFSNLSDGSVFTSNGNNFQVSYTGGDGNDLTLTVVP